MFARHDAEKRTSLIKGLENTQSILSRTLEHLAERDEPLSLAEAKRVAEIYKTLYDMTRLEDDKPTTITSEKAFDVEEIRKKLTNDPFGKKNVVDITPKVEEKKLEES